MDDAVSASASESDRYVRAVTNDEAWLVPIAAACALFAINTTARLAMFVATCAHESTGFHVLTESLHYSAARLLAVFPRHFTPQEATEFSCDDVRIAERVYGGRMGNGAEGVGDGYLYRGRGLIQLTGRAMYRDCGNALGVDLETMPELVAEREALAASSAAWLWSEKGCNAIADEGDFEAVTRKINGGTNGLADRLAWLDRVRHA